MDMKKFKTLLKRLAAFAVCGAASLAVCISPVFAAEVDPTASSFVLEGTPLMVISIILLVVSGLVVGLLGWKLSSRCVDCAADETATISLCDDKVSQRALNRAIAKNVNPCS
jgi:hypothetical protein